jgi:hypothetical protein
MSLQFADAPAQGSAAVQTALARLATRETPLSRGGIDASALHVSEPHAVYDLAADAVASGGGLDTATMTGYRYLVEGAGGPVAAAEVHADETGGVAQAAQVNLGPYVAASRRAFADLAAHPAVEQGSYEARMLRFSAIALVVLWLKSDTGSEDIVYPLAPAPPELKAEQAYTADEFLNVIRPLAQKRAEESGEAVP